eukprot:scaffold267280_cov30-Tisochrysis_lutea.AAC.13
MTSSWPGTRSDGKPAFPVDGGEGGEVPPHPTVAPRTRTESRPVVPDWAVSRRDALWIMAPRGTASPWNVSSMSAPAPSVAYSPLEVTVPVDNSSTSSSPTEVCSESVPRKSGSTMSEGVTTSKAAVLAASTVAALPQMTTLFSRGREAKPSPFIRRMRPPARLLARTSGLSWMTTPTWTVGSSGSPMA